MSLANIWIDNKKTKTSLIRRDSKEKTWQVFALDHYDHHETCTKGQKITLFSRFSQTWTTSYKQKYSNILPKTSNQPYQSPQTRPLL